MPEYKPLLDEYEAKLQERVEKGKIKENTKEYLLQGCKQIV